MEKLTGRHEGLVSPVPLLRWGSVADGGRAWMVVGVGVRMNAGALFSSKNFDKMSTVAIMFVFDKYCPIID